MRGDQARRDSTSIGALTRRDRFREATLNARIDGAYRDMSTTGSARKRRRHLRVARRNERALVAQQRRPQSVLHGLAIALLAVLVAMIATRTSLTVMAIVAALLFIDVRVLRRRRRTLRRA
jgi:hypothetical protein